MLLYRITDRGREKIAKPKADRVEMQSLKYLRRVTPTHSYVYIEIKLSLHGSRSPSLSAGRAPTRRSVRVASESSESQRVRPGAASSRRLRSQSCSPSQSRHSESEGSQIEGESLVSEPRSRDGSPDSHRSFVASEDDEGDVRAELDEAIALHGPRVGRGRSSRSPPAKPGPKERKAVKAKRAPRERAGRAVNGCKRYVGTLNNPPADTDDFFKRFTETHCVFLAGGYEEGEEKETPHFQYFFDLLRPRTMASLHHEFPDRFGHLEPRKGNIRQNEEYCSKQGELVVYGTLPPPDGERSDLELLYIDAKSHLGELACADRQTSSWMRFNKSFQRARQLARAIDYQGFRAVKVYVFWGDAGSGKTREVFKRAPNCFMFPAPTANGVVWADGLGDHREVCLDDFSSVIPFGELLRLLDGHPLSIPVKGGFVQAGYTRVYITSNFHPNEWYPSLRDEHRAALTRRLSIVKKFTIKASGGFRASPEELGSDEEMAVSDNE